MVREMVMVVLTTTTTTTMMMMMTTTMMMMIIIIVVAIIIIIIIIMLMKRQWSMLSLSRPENIATKGEGIGHFDTELYPSPSLFLRLTCPKLHPPPPHQTRKNNNKKTIKQKGRLNCLA